MSSQLNADPFLGWLWSLQLLRKLWSWNLLDTWSYVSLLTVITKVWERKRRLQCKLVKYFRLQLPPNVLIWQPKKDQTYLYCFLYVCCAHMFIQVFAVACVWSPQEEKRICFKTHSMYGWFHTRGQVPDLCPVHLRSMNTNVPCLSTVHHPCTGPPFQTDSCVLGQSMHEVCPRCPCPNKELGSYSIWPTCTFKPKTRLHMVKVEVGKPATWSLLAPLKLKTTGTVLKRTPLCRDVLYTCTERLWTGVNTSK